MATTQLLLLCMLTVFIGVLFLLSSVSSRASS